MENNFGERAKEFIEKTLENFEMTDPHDLERVRMAGKCLDELAEAETRVRLDGRFVQDRYGCVKEHPAMKTIRDTRTLFVRIIRELGLDLPVPESRPPRQY